MSRNTAIKLNSFLDIFFGILMLFGLIGIGSQTLESNKQLSELSERYSHLEQLNEQKKTEVALLRNELTARNSEISGLINEQRETMARYEKKTVTIQRIIQNNKCIRGDNVSRSIINRLLNDKG